jgi:hypothetical protein
MAGRRALEVPPPPFLELRQGKFLELFNLVAEVAVR